MWYVIGGIAVLVVGFLGWRITSVGRGMQQRDARLLADLTFVQESLAQGEPVAPEAIADAFTHKPQHRPLLYSLLEQHGRLDLFPDSWCSTDEQARALLAYWLMHPNEFQDPPASIECVGEMTRKMDGQTVEFRILRFRMPAGHWSGDQVWHVGVAGPFPAGAEDFRGQASAFSRRGDTEGKTDTNELVDWFLDACGH